MLNAFASLKCSKKCQHNVQKPNPSGQKSVENNVVSAKGTPLPKLSSQKMHFILHINYENQLNKLSKQPTQSEQRSNKRWQTKTSPCAKYINTVFFYRKPIHIWFPGISLLALVTKQMFFSDRCTSPLGLSLFRLNGLKDSHVACKIFLGII